jgi:hypothetical protein
MPGAYPQNPAHNAPAAINRVSATPPPVYTQRTFSSSQMPGAYPSGPDISARSRNGISRHPPVPRDPPPAYSILDPGKVPKTLRRPKGQEKTWTVKIRIGKRNKHW